MKIGFILDQIIVCGGVLTCYNYVKELRKRGYEADIYANGKNEQLSSDYNYNSKPISDLADFSDEDVIICVWWPQADQLEQYKGRKIQFIQGRDDLAAVGEDWVKKCYETRMNKKWELIAVSKYCMEWIDRDDYVIIPNGISQKFLDYAKN